MTKKLNSYEREIYDSISDQDLHHKIYVAFSERQGYGHAAGMDMAADFLSHVIFFFEDVEKRKMIRHCISMIRKRSKEMFIQEENEAKALRLYIKNGSTVEGALAKRHEENQARLKAYSAKLKAEIKADVEERA